MLYILFIYVKISAKYSGVHYYYFSYTSNGTRFFIKKKDGHIGHINDGDLFQLTVHSNHYETPDFLKGGIMYQIFPDRFCKSGKLHQNIPSGRVIRDDWGGVPYYKPDENGHVWNNDYFGGDLEGIRSKLGYLSDLGVTCIYLNPIFESHENHRYNTADYMKVDPLLGTNEDFKKLCEDAKEYGISIILDGVFSHTGADSVYFNKFSRYDSIGAYNSKESPYYPWYTFYNYPNEYEAWWGIDTLPNVVETNPDYTKFICGDGGVLDYWIEQGAAGFRLDVDDNGKVIDGDHILYLCGKYLKEQGKLKDDTVVTTVMSNMGLYKAFDKLGIHYEQTAVGDKYVCENMMANSYVIGGEQSGHIIFKEHAVTGDGILTSLMIMEAWLHYGKPMSMLTGDLVIYPQLLENVKVKDKVAAREDEDVQKAAKEVTESLGDAGRLLLRESGTEPLIRVMVEAETDEMCRENVDKIVKVLHEKGHVPD